MGLKKGEEMFVQIRRQTPHDVEGVLQVYYQTWLDTYPNKNVGITREDIEAHFENAFSQEAMQKRRRFLEQIKDNELALLAEVNGRVVGVCGVVKNELENRLRTIYVLPEYQGKGIGSKMWETAKEFLDAQKETVVDVADYNQNAINFYKSKGFIETGMKKQEERFRMKSGAIITEIEMKKPMDNP